MSIFRSIIISSSASFLLFASRVNAALPESAIINNSSQEREASIDWGRHEISDGSSAWSQYLARVELGKVDDGITYTTNDIYCKIEENKFVVYSAQPNKECAFSSDQGITKKYSLRINFEDFSFQVADTCGELAIRGLLEDESIEGGGAEDKPDENDQANGDGKEGFLSLDCEQNEDTFRVSVTYTPNYSISGSLRHELYGKDKNFKVYEFVGAGKLLDEEDVVLNSFVLKNKEGHRNQRLSIIKNSFMLIHQSPFEVELGLGLNQLSYTGSDGDFSTFSVRGIIGIHYVFLKYGLLSFETLADVFALDDSNIESSGNTFFFYNTRLMLGSRIGKRHSLTLLGGLSFSKYSYSIEQNRRLYTRQGFLGKAIYSSRLRGQIRWYIEGVYQHYEAKNSVFNIKLGYRIFRKSRLMPWLEFVSSELSDNSEITNADQDSGQSIILGLSLDF